MKTDDLLVAWRAFSDLPVGMFAAKVKKVRGTRRLNGRRLLLLTVTVISTQNRYIYMKIEQEMPSPLCCICRISLVFSKIVHYWSWYRLFVRDMRTTSSWEASLANPDFQLPVMSFPKAHFLGIFFF